MTAPEITQADREAAAEFGIGHGYVDGVDYSAGYMIRNGHWDHKPIVQAFARHRARAGQVTGWQLIEALKPQFGEVLGWADGCGYEVVRGYSDGHRYAGAFTADWVTHWTPSPIHPPATASAPQETIMSETGHWISDRERIERDAPADLLALADAFRDRLDELGWHNIAERRALLLNLAEVACAARHPTQEQAS